MQVKWCYIPAIAISLQVLAKPTEKLNVSPIKSVSKAHRKVDRYYDLILLVRISVVLNTRSPGTCERSMVEWSFNRVSLVSATRAVER